MGEFDIKIDTSQTYRPRRSSGFGQGLIRVLFFAIMIIPTCIIAWRIDLVNPRSQQQVVQQQRPQAVQQPAPTPEIMRREAKLSVREKEPVRQRWNPSVKTPDPTSESALTSDFDVGEAVTDLFNTGPHDLTLLVANELDEEDLEEDSDQHAAVHLSP